MDQAEIAKAAAPALEAGVAKLVSWVEASAQFAVEQAPVAAQEMVRFGIVWNGLVALLLVPSILTLILVWRKAMDIERGYEKAGATYSSGFGYFMGAIATMGLALPFGFAANALKLCLLAYFAPRIYILEQLKGLL